ncbi:respiratory nitrate reductase subunit gamma [Marimonas arenosa]|uniref:Respiratory nitrate reductase subunit gamma n=1 Tax=Marimonas arenosa TaxID=1795305 RepID=A0AAE3WBE7_9RHOB|nr:respiratory nitrate reductase subunit gamma [Marimonas arenosa]MDQ2089378.1 respiratory nitrate reductase subunit gamma [Marimonas arenosa]
MISALYAILFWVATVLLVVGLAMKIRKYARTPAPLKIPTTPAPTTRTGVVLRMFREVIFFESLFKSNKWIWLFGWAFHMGMWLVLIRHIRYFQWDVSWWVSLAQPFGTYASFAMLFGLLGLWARRFLVERIRYISNPSDHLMLALLVLIVGSGMMMRFVVHTDIIQVKAFMLGLMRLRIETLPTDPILLVHLGAVAALMIIFPISKLLHAPGVFFSPSRNQVDNPREVRHIAPWAKKLES